MSPPPMPPEEDGSIRQILFNLSQYYVPRTEFESRLRTQEVSTRRLIAGMKELRASIDKLAENIDHDRQEEWQYRYGVARRGSGGNAKSSEDGPASFYERTRAQDFQQTVTWVIMGALALLNVSITIVLFALSHKP